MKISTWNQAVRLLKKGKVSKVAELKPRWAGMWPANEKRVSGRVEQAMNKGRILNKKQAREMALAENI